MLVPSICMHVLVQVFCLFSRCMLLFFYDLRAESTSFKQLLYPALYSILAYIHICMYADGHNHLPAKKSVKLHIFETTFHLST
jgi:hypothetical protein